MSPYPDAWAFEFNPLFHARSVAAASEVSEHLVFVHRCVELWRTRRAKPLLVLATFSVSSERPVEP